ncbi:RHS repeat-associated core domain-containing protein [Chryseobacterium sp. JV274]|uniref:RHS repeat-associated core domain-containing protein n=1 Tax=unclassified Chryseobacterium TaxID=2593645 RepID=UPI0015C1DBE7|nr:RHS repeat-associated core domain-containing protein [Chryseobacterium sp. JV274]CAD0224914.1 protein of unknown function [Chryseobacterium sp. JV274]
MKVRKVFGTETTDYLDGFQYTNSVLKFFPTAEGYFNVETGKYVYNYTDHLGNVRLSYAKSGAGTEIIEESNYYPFGLKHEGYNVLSGNSAYKYKYNGKELQETGMYDYGARMYMPDLGRWGVQDALGELYYNNSPYSYVTNNPIRLIDPTGMWIDIQDGDTTYRYNNGKLYTQNGKTKKWDVEASVGDTSYAGQILSALTSISSDKESSFGKTFLGLFANDNINTTIQSSEGTSYAGKNGTYTDGSGVVTSFTQDVNTYTSKFGETPIKTKIPFHVTLFHELGHSFFDQTASHEELGKSWVNADDENNFSKDIPQSEIAASYIENLLRSEQGLPIRTSYSPDAAISTTLVNTNSIQWRPTVRNVNTRVFTMPVNVQVIYNKILNSKK